jgi:hypothetical protein
MALIGQAIMIQLQSQPLLKQQETAGKILQTV